jgi:pimeloyl-ACP methyl ester carboxylesterase
MTVSERYVHTGNIALNVAEWAPPNDDAPVMVLIHGYGSNRHTWGRVSDKFSTQFHLFAVDLRGMGRSGRFGKYAERQTWAEDISDCIPMLTKKPVVLVGHSLGGWVTAAVASRNPELVSHAVLAEPYSGANSEVRKRERMRSNEQREARANQIRNASTPEDLLPFVSQEYEGASEDSLRRVARMWFELDPILESGRTNPREEHETFDEMFTSIQCPTILIQGAADKGGIMSDEEAERVRDLIPNCNLLSWPKVGHSPHIARNHDFIRAVNKLVAHN